MHEKFPKGQQMANLEKTRMSPAIASIDEGNALEEQGRIAEAMARYDAAVKADPRCARAHLNRGNILFAAGQIDEARSAYQLAIVCDPHYAGAHFNLGNLNARAADFEHALRNYQAAIVIKPDFSDAKAAFGACVACMRFMVDDSELCHGSLGNSVPAFPSGTQSDPAQPEDRQVCTRS
jgi:tetratricopeptide (TPR) repeat protein